MRTSGASSGSNRIRQRGSSRAWGESEPVADAQCLEIIWVEKTLAEGVPDLLRVKSISQFGEG
jgi:hypothetical protein